MYTIYINEFLRDGQVVTTEEVMYDIPSWYPEEEMLIDPTVKNEMGKAGTFEFGMEPPNPWYSSLLQMRTRFRVDYDGTCIFFGRVLSIDTNLYGKRTVHCEGALAFLLDTLMESSKEEERQEISLQTYISDLIHSHNNITEAWKHFELGEVPGHYSLSVNSEQKPMEDTLRKFGTSSWTSILNCLEELTTKYGGYWRTRHENGVNYIDWLCNYFNPQKNDQKIQLGENVIDMNNSVDVNGIFTALIPEGVQDGKPLYLDTPPYHILKIPVVTPKDNGEGGGES